MHAIGIDIGVSNIKSVVVSDGGRIVAEESTPTLSDDPEWPERDAYWLLRQAAAAMVEIAREGVLLLQARRA